MHVKKRDELGAKGEQRSTNGDGIPWARWVQGVETLTAWEAACLMCGLNPDKFPNLDARLVQANDPASVARDTARLIERMALQLEMESATPSRWLQFGRGILNFTVHEEFALAVTDKRKHQDMRPALSGLPAPEAERWISAPVVDHGVRSVWLRFVDCHHNENMTLESFCDEVTTRLERWRAGNYEVCEAAEVLRGQHPKLVKSARSLCESIEIALRKFDPKTGAPDLPLRRNAIPLQPHQIPFGRLYNQQVLQDDLNEWLKKTKPTYALRYPYERDDAGAATATAVPVAITKTLVSRAAAIAAFSDWWPAIKGDLSNLARKPGLSDCRVGKRGWDLEKLKAWGEANAYKVPLKDVPVKIESTWPNVTRHTLK